MRNTKPSFWQQLPHRIFDCLVWLFFGAVLTTAFMILLAMVVAVNNHS